jgi:hypothetical protein
MSEEEEAYITTLRHFRSDGGRGPKRMVVEKVAAGTDSAQFLRRMEGRRRDQLERRPIDLRRSIGERRCHPYDYAGMTHYLDAAAQETLEKALEQTDGRYTVGVYEDVTETTSTLHSRMESMRSGRLRRRDGASQVVSLARPAGGSESEDDEPTLEVIPFGFFTERSEQRMNYVVDVELVLPDGEIAPARTVDLSPRGLRVRTQSMYGFQPDNVLGVKFSAFAARFDASFAGPYAYSVAEVDPRDKYTLLRLSLERPEEHDDITEFIKTFINDNSHRYKYDTGDQELNVTTKAFERLYLQGLRNIAVLLGETDDGQPYVDCLLRSQQNDQALSALKNRLGGYEVSRLMPEEALSGVIERAQQQQATHVFLLSIKRGDKSHYFRATAEQLQAESGLRQQMFSLSQLPNASLRAWRIELQAVDLARDQELMIAVTSMDKRQGPVAEALSKRLHGLRWLGRLTEVTRSIVPDGLALDTSTTIDEGLRALKAWAVPDFDDVPPASVEDLQISYQAQRRHPRYQLRSGLKAGSDGQVSLAQMANFSEDGMQITTDNRLDVKLGSRVEVTFDEMYKRTKREELVRVAFDVVGGDPHRHELRLAMVEDNSKSKKNKAFLHSVIERNRDRLTETTDETAQVAYVRMVERILVTSLISVPFFISQDENFEIQVRHIVVSEVSSPLLWFFRTDDDQYDLAMVTQDANLRNLVNAGSLFEPHKAKPVESLLYLFKDVDDQTGQDRVVGRMESELADAQQRSALVKRAQQSYDYRFIQLSVSAVGSLMEGELDHRFAAIRRSNPHHYKTLRERLAQIIGLGDLIDVTEEVLMREQWQAK